MDILNLISEGQSKKEIATSLHISPKTVCVHVSHIYQKMNVPNAAAAVNKAYRLGIFSSDQ